MLVTANLAVIQICLLGSILNIGTYLGSDQPFTVRKLISSMISGGALGLIGNGVFIILIPSRKDEGTLVAAAIAVANLMGTERLQRIFADIISKRLKKE